MKTVCSSTNFTSWDCESGVQQMSNSGTSEISPLRTAVLVGYCVLHMSNSTNINTVEQYCVTLKLVKETEFI